MKKKYVGIAILGAFLILFVVIPMYTQLTKPEARSFRMVPLEEDTISREVTFQNFAQGIRLAGMLFVPEGEGPFPAAIFIHGSGASRRHNPWQVTLTQYLLGRGIAVLVPDKRGSEKSEGDWHTASFEDLATDTLAAVAFLRDQDNVPVSEIGVIGISQGGHIAPIVASESPDVGFLVDVVGSSLPMHEVLLYEENHNLREIGLIPGLSNIMAYPSTFVLRNIAKRDFWDAVGNFDPLPYWEKVAVSSLVLFGEKDTNVPSEKSAERLESLDKSNIKVKIYEGSSHALEDPEAGDFILREDALKDIRDFIHHASALAKVGAAVAESEQASDQGLVLSSIAPLDEARGYCLDIPGHMAGVEIQSPLHVHTCKHGIWNQDGLFDAAALGNGVIRMPHYELCLQAENTSTGARLLLGECTEAKLQTWTLQDSGEIALEASPQICITVEEGPGRNAGGPQYLIRGVGLDICAPHASDRQRWTTVIPR